MAKNEGKSGGQGKVTLNRPYRARVQVLFAPKGELKGSAARLCNFPPLSETSKSDSIPARRPSTLCEIPPHSRPMVRSVLSKTSDCPPQYNGLLRQTTDKIRAGPAGSTDCKNRPTEPDTIWFDSPREPFETVLFLLPAISLSLALGLTVYAKLRCIATVGTER